MMTKPHFIKSGPVFFKIKDKEKEAVNAFTVGTLLFDCFL